MAGPGQQESLSTILPAKYWETKDINEEMKKEKCDNYYYSKAQIDRNRIIEIIAKSRKPL